MENKIDTQALQPGDKLSRVSYMEVLDRTPMAVRVRNEEGMTWTIGNNIVANEAYSANQYTNEIKVSRTEMVEALESAGDSVFTVTFDKKVNQKDLVNQMAELQQDTNSFLEMSARDIGKLAKSLLSGSERRLVGYLTSTEPRMGRSTVVDLEAPAATHRLRLVDHRTLKSLVLRNVRYVLK